MQTFKYSLRVVSFCNVHRFVHIMFVIGRHINMFRCVSPVGPSNDFRILFHQDTQFQKLCRIWRIDTDRDVQNT